MFPIPVVQSPLLTRFQRCQHVVVPEDFVWTCFELRWPKAGIAKVNGLLATNILEDPRFHCVPVETIGNAEIVPRNRLRRGRSSSGQVGIGQLGETCLYRRAQDLSGRRELFVDAGKTDFLVLLYGREVRPYFRTF